MSEELNNQKQLSNEKQKQASYNQELAQQEQKRIEQSRLALEYMKEMNLSYDKQIKMQSDIVRKMIEQAELTGDMTADFRAFATLQSEANDVINNSVQLQENFFTKAAGTIQTFVAATEARKKALEEIDSLEKEIGAATRSNLDALMSQNKELTEQEAVKERIKVLEEKRTKTGEELDEQEQQEIKLLKQKLVLKELELQKENQILAAGLKGIEQAGKALGSYSDNVIGKLSQVGSEMYKATGGNLDLINNIQQSFDDLSSINPMSGLMGTDELAKYGLGFENLSESIVNLSQRSGEFATASIEIQKQVGLTTAKMQQLGVSVETSADLFNTMRLNFGFSASEFGEMADEMVANAADIGMSVEQYTQDFQSSFPVLSQYGTGAVKVFDKLSRAAKASGLSVQELTQAMGRQFDTFESAAENASKLNFLLGSQLDTTQLLMADEAERLEMIKGAFSPAQFQNMDKFKKKAIMAAAGFTDVAAFEKAMRGDADSLASLTKDNSEDLNTATEKSTDAALKFSKGLENAKDKAVLAIHDLTDAIGQEGAGLYGGTKAAAFGLENLTGALQMAASAAEFFTMMKGMGSVPGGSTGVIKNVLGSSGIKGSLTNFRAAGGISANPLNIAKAAKSSFSAAKSGMSGAAKFMSGAGGLLSAGMIVKDIADMGQSYLSGEDIKKEDMGGAIGGILGGAIGVIGGPAGMAIGAGIGNTLGETLGSMFDEDKEDKKKKDKEQQEMKRIAIEAKEAAQESARYQKKMAADSEWNKNKESFRSIVGTRSAHLPTGKPAT